METIVLSNKAARKSAKKRRINFNNEKGSAWSFGAVWHQTVLLNKTANYSSCSLERSCMQRIVQINFFLPHTTPSLR